jgi:hypothetical protein
VCWRAEDNPYPNSLGGADAHPGGQGQPAEDREITVGANARRNHVKSIAIAGKSITVEWHPDRTDFFVGDHEYFTLPREGPSTWTFDRKFYLLVNLAVGGTWGGQKGVDAGAFPQKYLVDHVPCTG